MAKKCGVCQTGDLIPSSCGCLNKDCFNYVEKWRPATCTYAAPKTVETPEVDKRSPECIIQDEKIANEPQLPPVILPTEAKPLPVEAFLEPVKRKRGRPKKDESRL
jgi:hypothetical protein